MCLIVGFWRESFSVILTDPLSTVTRQSPLKLTALGRLWGVIAHMISTTLESITHTCTQDTSSALYLAFIYSTRQPYEIGNTAPS